MKNEKRQAFYPGKVWLDTEGKRIQAHGGSVMYIDGVYYWYGENKEKTDGVNGIWHWGVRCYKSTNLYNWEDCGIIIPPEPENPKSSLHPTKCMDRPHIIYNERTKKYVCWLKVMDTFDIQSQTILTADHILGPYTKVREGLRPLEMNGGDFDLAVAPDGKAYYYFERVHTETICADLTDDYTDVTGYYTTHFPRVQPPYVREATAHFYRKGKHYLLTSGTTGYLPNPSEVAVADTWHGPYLYWEIHILMMKVRHLFIVRFPVYLRWQGRKISILPVRIVGFRRIWIKNIRFTKKCLNVFMGKKRRNLISAGWEKRSFKIRPLLIMYGFH